MIPGKFIRLLRQLKGIKQAAIARKLGVSQQAYSKMENAEMVQEDKEKAILNALECTEKDIEIIKNISPPPPHARMKIDNGYGGFFGER